MDYMKIYNEWLESDYFDQKTKDELLAIKDDQKEIEQRKYKKCLQGYRRIKEQTNNDEQHNKWN